MRKTGGDGEGAKAAMAIFFFFSLVCGAEVFVNDLCCLSSGNLSSSFMLCFWSLRTV